MSETTEATVETEVKIPVIPDEYFVGALRLIGMASLNGAYHASEFRKVGGAYDQLNALLQEYAHNHQSDAPDTGDETDKDDNQKEPARLTIDHLFIIEHALQFALEREKLGEHLELAQAVYDGFKEHNDAIRKQSEIAGAE